MPNLPFKFDADAWLTGKAQILNAQEKGIFIDMAALAWKEDGAVRNNDFLHRALRVNKGTLTKAKATLIATGLIREEDGVFVVNFIEEQLKTRNAYILKQKEFGRKGGKISRKNKATLGVPLGYPKATLTEEKKEKVLSPETPISKREDKEALNSSDVPSSEFSLEQEISSCGPGNAKRKIFFDYEGDCKFHGIDDETMERWREAYPALDVDYEILSAGSWLDANRKNRKYDIKRFLVGWLKRAQDRAKTQTYNNRDTKDYTGL
jgi:hypothetical protein